MNVPADPLRAPGVRLFRRHGRRWLVQLNIQWESRDAWVGLFWRRSPAGLLHIYVCLVPLVPLHLTVLDRRRPRATPGDLDDSFAEGPHSRRRA